MRQNVNFRLELISQGRVWRRCKKTITCGSKRRRLQYTSYGLLPNAISVVLNYLCIQKRWDSVEEPDQRCIFKASDWLKVWIPRVVDLEPSNTIYHLEGQTTCRKRLQYISPQGGQHGAMFLGQWDCVTCNIEVVTRCNSSCNMNIVHAITQTRGAEI